MGIVKHNLRRLLASAAAGLAKVCGGSEVVIERFTMRGRRTVSSKLLYSKPKNLARVRTQHIEIIRQKAGSWKI